jgi:ankyrin repeat protein
MAAVVPNVIADANLVEGVAYRKLTMVTEALDSGANVNLVTAESGKTPLHIITSMGRPADNAKLVPIVTLLLSRGANPNVQNNDGMTPLMYATAAENAEIMKLLLDAGADRTIQQNSSNGRTALRIANEFRFADGIRLLQERQAAANPITAIASAVASVVAPAPAPAPNPEEDRKLLFAVMRGDIDGVRAALAAGADVNTTGVSANKNTPLHHAVSSHVDFRQKMYPIVDLLLEKGANVNAQRSDDGQTPFTMSFYESKFFYALFQKRPDLTLKIKEDPRGREETPLQYATRRFAARPEKRYISAVIAKAELGEWDGAIAIAREEADIPAPASPVAAVAEAVQSAVASVVAPAAPRDVNKELIDAARRGSLDKVKELLDAGANVNYKDERKLTPIMYAIAGEHLDIVKELIARGADITIADDNGATPLHLAAYSDEIEILKRIIDTHLAESDDLNAQDNRGDTALHTAAAGGYANAVILLLNNGASSTIRNDDRLTAYDIANSPELRALFPAPPPAYVSAPDPVPIEFEVMKIQLKNQKVYDFEEAEEVPMLSVLSKSNSVIFKAKESYFTLPLTTIVKAIKDGSQIRHRCKAQLEGAPYERDVDMVHQYYYIQGNGNFLVWLDQIQQGLLQDYRIFDLEETDEELDNVASAQIVQKSPGTNRYGNPVNIVSADHCQAGTKQKVFKLIPIIFTDEAQPPPGEKRRRAEADQSEASQAADILRGLRTGARRRTWKRRKNSRKTRKSRK